MGHSPVFYSSLERPFSFFSFLLLLRSHSLLANRPAWTSWVWSGVGSGTMTWLTEWYRMTYGRYLMKTTELQHAMWARLQVECVIPQAKKNSSARSCSGSWLHEPSRRHLRNVAQDFFLIFWIVVANSDCLTTCSPLAIRSGSRVQDGHHWYPIKVAGCLSTGVPGFRMGTIDVLSNLQGLQVQHRPPLMSYKGCRLPIHMGSRVEDGVDWCAMKAVGCQPKRMGPIDVLWRL